MVSLPGGTGRTLFFDMLPSGVGAIRGLTVKFELYAAPGEADCAEIRKQTLRGVDGVVFVADSLKIRHEKNILSLKNLAENLKGYGLNIMKIPLVMQWNKRDLAKEGVPLMSVEEMQHAYNRQLKAPAFSASAVSGHGVNDTLKTCLILTLKSLKKEAGWE